jgi:signal transduction histidine kinase
MKNISITKKITLLYTITLIAISAVFLAVMFYSARYEAGESVRRVLMEEVADASEEVSRSGSSFTVDSSMQYYHNGVYISIFGSDGKLIEGRRPATLGSLPKLSDKELRRVTDQNGKVWYMYDSKFVLNGRTLWVRGISDDYVENSTFSALLRFLIFGIPVLIIVAAVGGYFITKRAFKPVGEAVETAYDITRDGDLSRRLPEISGGDEVSRMTDAFNGMFDRLEKTVDDEKRFTNDAAHELRTPLAVIMSQSEYALEDPDYSRRALEVINGEARTMSQMVNQLLMLARGDAGRLDVHASDLDLSELCRGVAEQQEAAAEDCGMKIVCDIEDGIHAYADEFMTIRMLLNLISNAFKYGRSEEGIVTVSVRGGEDGMSSFSVADSGRGIPAEELERIWDRFYRGDHKDDSGEKDTESGSSSGLGLAIVKSLAEAQGGRVSVESVPDEKTVFTVELPASGSGPEKEDRKQ